MSRDIWLAPEFRQLEVGQQLVTSDGYDRLHKHTIARLSQTSIWLEDGRRFNRSDGHLWGETSIWHPTTIVRSGWLSQTNRNQPMTWAELDALNAEKEAERARRRRIARLGETQWAHFTDGQLVRLANEIAHAEAAYVECSACENLQWEQRRRERGW
ncbi:MAG: hypothetical protein GX616_10060 [Planctomycetes bacterium]|nr:hypothetical protein [Planctomycetota bacterium]